MAGGHLMTAQVFRINEAALLRAGLDPVSVKALSNMARVVGVTGDSPTVSQLDGKAAENAALTVVLREQIEMLQGVLDVLGSGVEALGVMPPVPVAEQVDHLTTEVRQIAEQVAYLASQINELKQGPL